MNVPLSGPQLGAMRTYADRIDGASLDGEGAHNAAVAIRKLADEVDRLRAEVAAETEACARAALDAPQACGVPGAPCTRDAALRTTIAAAIRARGAR
jgi:hypothetical protein